MVQGQVFLKMGKWGGGKGSYFSFFTRLSFSHLEIILVLAKLCYALEEKLFFYCHIVLWKKDSLFTHELVKFDKWTGKITLLIFVQTCWLWNRKVGKLVCWIREGVGCMRLGGTVWNTLKRVEQKREEGKQRF